MADNYTDFGVIGDLSPTEQGGAFPVTLDYVSTAHFGVTITNGASLDKTTLTTDQFTVSTDTGTVIQLTFSAIPEYSDPLALIDMVRVYRTTPTTVAERTFVDGSVLKASDINTQNKQLLLGIQERGKGDITIDTDGKLDAAANLAGVATQIKNVALPEFDSEVATKEYVDNASVYGSAFGAGDPQYWTFETVEDDGRIYTLDDPDPASTASNMFLVEIGGVLQDPETYTITLSSGTYYLTIIDGTNEDPENGVEVIVRNFGAARNIISQPYQHKDDLAATVALQVRRLSATTEGPLQEWQDESGAPIASVEYDGDIYIGKKGATQWASRDNIRIRSGWGIGGVYDDDPATWGFNRNYVDFELGNWTETGNDSGMLIDRRGEYEDDKGYCRILMSAQENAVTSNSIIRANINSVSGSGFTDVFNVKWNGDITAAGDLTCDEVFITGGSSGAGIQSSGSEVGTFYHGADGPSMQYDAGHYLQSQSDEVFIRGDLKVSGGDLTVGGGITVNPEGATYGTMTLKGSFQIKSNEYTGHIGVTSAGPQMKWDEEHRIRQTETRLTVRGPLWMQTDVIDMEGNYDKKKIINMAEPTDASDAATKNYVDTHGKVLLQTINGANDGTGIVEQTGCSAYSEIQMEFHNVKNDTTGEGEHPPAFRLRNSDGDTLDPLVAGTQSATAYKMDETHWYADNLNWLIGSKWVSIGDDDTTNRWENYAWSGLATFRMIGNAILLNFWASINLPGVDGEWSFGDNVALWHGEYIYNSSSLATMDQIRFAFIESVSTNSPQNGSGVGAGTVKVYGIE